MAAVKITYLTHFFVCCWLLPYSEHFTGKETTLLCKTTRDIIANFHIQFGTTHVVAVGKPPVTVRTSSHPNDLTSTVQQHIKPNIKQQNLFLLLIINFFKIK